MQWEHGHSKGETTGRIRHKNNKIRVKNTLEDEEGKVSNKA